MNVPAKTVVTDQEKKKSVVGKNMTVVLEARRGGRQVIETRGDKGMGVVKWAVFVALRFLPNLDFETPT